MATCVRGFLYTLVLLLTVTDIEADDRDRIRAACRQNTKVTFYESSVLKRKYDMLMLDQRTHDDTWYKECEELVEMVNHMLSYKFIIADALKSQTVQGVKIYKYLLPRDREVTGFDFDQPLPHQCPPRTGKNVDASRASESKQKPGGVDAAAAKMIQDRHDKVKESGKQSREKSRNSAEVLYRTETNRDVDFEAGKLIKRVKDGAVRVLKEGAGKEVDENVDNEAEEYIDSVTPKNEKKPKKPWWKFGF